MKLRHRLRYYTLPQAIVAACCAAAILVPASIVSDGHPLEAIGALLETVWVSIANLADGARRAVYG